MRKLSRNEYKALEKIKDGVLSLSEAMLVKFLTYNLVEEVPAVTENKYCSYTLSEIGLQYFKDNPEIPPIVLTEKQAELIYRFVGANTYECVPSFNSSGGAWDSLKYEGIIEPDIAPGGNSYSGYRLTEIGRKAFERTEPGQNYLKRMALLKKQELADIEWEKTKTSKNKDEVSRYTAKAKFMKKRGLDQYAANIMHQVDAYVVRNAIKDVLKDVTDDIAVGLDNDLSFNTITVCNLQVTKMRYHGSGHDIVAWHVRNSVYIDTHEHPQDVENLINSLQKASEAARIMNEKYPVEEKENK